MLAVVVTQFSDSTGLPMLAASQLQCSLHISSVSKNLKNLSMEECVGVELQDLKKTQ